LPSFTRSSLTLSLNRAGSAKLLPSTQLHPYSRTVARRSALVPLAIIVPSAPEKSKTMLDSASLALEMTEPVGGHGADASSGAETVKQTRLEQLKATAVYVGLGGGVVSSAVAMAAFHSIPTIIMGAVCIAQIPYAAFKESQLGKLPSKSDPHNSKFDMIVIFAWYSFQQYCSPPKFEQ